MVNLDLQILITGVPLNQLTTNTQSRRTKMQWQQLLNDFDAGQDTIAQFCKLHQVSCSTFYQWRKKLMDESKDNAAPLFVQMTQSDNTQSSATPVWDIELELGAGIILRMKRPC